MPIYFYKARDLSGQMLNGELQASSQSEVATTLQRKGLFVTLISDKPFTKKEAKIEKQEATQTPKKEFVLFGRITGEDKMVFSVQLANMVSAGLPLVRALHIILQQMKNPKFRSVLDVVYNDVEGGMAFSDALEKHPKVFPPYFTSSVKAGEISGQLGTVLERVASFAEHDMEVKQNIQAAMTYPIILVVVGTGIVFFIVTGVIPAFVSTFVRIGIELPLPTQIMYNVSMFLKKQWYILFGAIGILIVLLRTSSATTVGKLWLDRLKLNIPFMGPMVEKFELSRFSKTFGMLLGCGVPILQALKIVQKNVGSEVFSRATEKVHEQVRQGIRVADALKEAKDFPVDLIQMVAVGEETGRLDQLLNRLGDYYDTTAKYAVKKFMAMLEPIFLVVLGTLIAFIMASVLLPIFDMMKLLRQGG
ncbi:MAG: type II secretion system F family protein [Candidatus Omnitrophota bacterium]|nr:type II secretion system F family protein [Candidatus Omnitrophota bacterium]